MAIRNSYAGRLTSKFKTSGILLEIKKATVLTPPHGYNDHILLVTENMSEVPPFVHPLLDEQTGRVYIDARPYTLIERDGTLRVRNEADYDLNVMRAKMELIWKNASRTEIMSALEFPNEVFVRWLSELIAFKYKLNPGQQSDLISVCALYVVGQYLIETPEDRDLNRYVQNISNHYHLDATRLYSIYDQVGMPVDLESFISALHSLNISPRLNDLNALTLVHAIGGSWFISVWSMDIVSLALEYPPAFATLVFMAMKYKMFKRSSIGERVDRMNRRGNWEDFSRGIQSLFDRYIKDGTPVRQHGFEEYDTRFNPPAYPVVAMEADWTKIAIGTGAAAAVFYFIYKLYCWFSGSSGGGGGGGSSSGGLPAAVQKVATRVESAEKKAEAIVQETQAVAEETAEIVAESREVVTEQGVDAVVEALPEQVAAEVKPVVDNASTPLQSAVVAAIARASARDHEGEVKRLKYVLGAIAPIVNRHRMTDEQFIAALVGWELYSHQHGHDGISLLSVHVDSKDGKEIDSGYIRDLEKYLERLTHDRCWSNNPRIAAAFSSSAMMFVSENEVDPRVLEMDSLTGLVDDTETTISEYADLLYNVVTMVVGVANDQVAGRTDTATAERGEMIDDTVALLEKFYEQPAVKILETRHQRLQEMVNGMTVVELDPDDRRFNRSMASNFSSQSIERTMEQFKSNNHSAKQMLFIVTESTSNKKIHETVGVVDKVLGMIADGKLSGAVFGTERMTRLRNCIRKYLQICTIYGDVAKAVNLHLRFTEGNFDILHRHTRAEKAIQGQLNRAIKACKED